MKKASYTLSVIITAHSEGILIHRTLMSVRRALAELSKKQTHEIILHVDNPTAATQEYLAEHGDTTLHDVRVFTNAFGDLGASRNFAIQQATGKYISTIDADDIMTRDWLKSAIKVLEKSDAPTIAHSEFTLEFEGANAFVIKHGEIDYNTDTLLSVYANRWNSVIVAPRSLMLANPYSPNSPGYGYEDWNFNCRMIYQHVRNILVPGTAIFVRRKKMNSEWARQTSSMSILRANPLLSFDNIRRITNVFDMREPTRPTRGLPRARVERIIKENPSLLKVARTMRRRVEARLPIYRRAGASAQVPEWLQKEWKALHTIERGIFPTDELLSNLPTYDTITHDHKIAGKLYKQLVDQTRFDKYHYIIFVPWLVKGGADKYTIEYANTISSQSKSPVLVIGTLPVESPWSIRLSTGADFINFGLTTAEATDAVRNRLMEHLVEQSGAEVLHIINSELGYDFVLSHETYIRSSRKRVVVTSFSQSIDLASGRLYGYSHTHVPFIYDLAFLITSDNKAVLDMWIEEYGFSKNKLAVHRQPIDIRNTRKKRSYVQSDVLRVLWAGRIAPEKLPDVAVAIARMTPGATFDMYGSMEPGCAQIIKDLPNNAHYLGAYDGFDSLDIDSYDVLLYTSLFDGMPNVILEAASSGLPIVASAVGGIPEFIEDGVTGRLIKDIHNPEAYSAALKSLQDDTGSGNVLAKGAFRKLRTMYSRTQYTESVRSMLERLRK